MDQQQTSPNDMNGKLPFAPMGVEDLRNAPFDYSSRSAGENGREPPSQIAAAAEEQAARERDHEARQAAARATIANVVNDVLGSHLRTFAVPASLTLLAIVIATVALVGRGRGV